MPVDLVGLGVDELRRDVRSVGDEVRQPDSAVLQFTDTAHGGGLVHQTIADRQARVGQDRLDQDRVQRPAQVTEFDLRYDHVVRFHRLERHRLQQRAVVEVSREQPDRLGHRVGGVDAPVEGGGRAGVDRLSGPHPAQRERHADEAHEAHRSAPAGDDPQLDLGLTDDGLRADDALPARHAQLRTATEREAVVHGDDRLGERLHPEGQRLSHGREPGHLLRRLARGDAIDVRTGQDAPEPGEDDPAYVVVHLQVDEHEHQLRDRGSADRVHGLGPEDRDRGDAGLQVLLHQHVLERVRHRTVLEHAGGHGVILVLRVGLPDDPVDLVLPHASHGVEDPLLEGEDHAGHPVESEGVDHLLLDQLQRQGEQRRPDRLHDLLRQIHGGVRRVEVTAVVPGAVLIRRVSQGIARQVPVVAEGPSHPLHALPGQRVRVSGNDVVDLEDAAAAEAIGQDGVDLVPRRDAGLHHAQRDVDDRGEDDVPGEALAITDDHGNEAHLEHEPEDEFRGRIRAPGHDLHSRVAVGREEGVHDEAPLRMSRVGRDFAQSDPGRGVADDTVVGDDALDRGQDGVLDLEVLGRRLDDEAGTRDVRDFAGDGDVGETRGLLRLRRVGVESLLVGTMTSRLDLLGEVDHGQIACTRVVVDQHDGHGALGCAGHPVRQGATDATGTDHHDFLHVSKSHLSYPLQGKCGVLPRVMSYE